jgi:addiction module RelE/StbE family toxin
MKIRYSQKFKKQFKKLPKFAQDKFEKRLNLYLMEPNHPILRNHKLAGKYHQHRSINITGDYRLIFIRREKSLDLEFIGTHSQLY